MDTQKLFKKLFKKPKDCILIGKDFCQFTVLGKTFIASVKEVKKREKKIKKVGYSPEVI
jgi:hypothetical protein